jgi:hypothetical protein
MEYEAPEVRDYGDLLQLTAASGTFGNEDGTGKVVSVHADPLAEVTVQLFP